MIDLHSYGTYFGKHETLGERRKATSDMVMTYKWNGDIQSKIAYIYDYFHDDEPNLNYGLHPNVSESKTKVEIKYVTNTYNSDDRPQVSYHIQFMPNHECPLDYYDDIHKLCGSSYPIGLYCDIPDEKGIYRKWLIISNANTYELQFPTWSIIPCDERLHWRKNGIGYKMWGCRKTASSYSQGLDTGTYIERGNNSDAFIVPYNRLTSTLSYNTRMIISAIMESPLTWRVSKIANTEPRGIIKVTTTQDLFDREHDYIERDDDGNVIAMWADYYGQSPIPNNINESKKENDVKNECGIITYNGTKAVLKVNGSAKKFFVTFGENSLKSPTNMDINWMIEINGEDVSDLFEIKPNDEYTLIKFIGSEDYAGKTAVIKAKYDSFYASTEMKIELL